MPSIKDLKKRIGTVKNTQQTTKAMKMVSAAKLRRAQEAISAHRPFAKRILDLIHLVQGQVGESFSSPLIHRTLPEGVKPKLLLVLVTSDRGLCGGFNGGIIRAAQRWIAAEKQNYQSIELAFVGRKSYDFFKTKNYTLSGIYEEVGGKITFAKAKKVNQLILDSYLSEKVDEVRFVYNEFKNAVTQKLTVEPFLPLSAGRAQKAEEQASAMTDFYIFKPAPSELLEYLLEKNFATQVYRILLESQAGEHGARMSAMENATKNASEMIRKLTLLYNKQRQAGITKELLEIISGSESQKSA